MRKEIKIDHKAERDRWIGFVAPRLLAFVQEHPATAHAEDILYRAKDAGIGLGPIDKTVVQEALSLLANVGWISVIRRKSDVKGPNCYELTRDGAMQLSILFMIDHPGISVRIV